MPPVYWVRISNVMFWILAWSDLRPQYHFLNSWGQHFLPYVVSFMQPGLDALRLNPFPYDNNFR